MTSLFELKVARSFLYVTCAVTLDIVKARVLELSSRHTAIDNLACLQRAVPLHVLRGFSGRQCWLPTGLAQQISSFCDENHMYCIPNSPYLQVALIKIAQGQMIMTMIALAP
jgi:hypothetical protein